jgi:hypothetical protein
MAKDKDSERSVFVAYLEQAAEDLERVGVVKRAGTDAKGNVIWELVPATLERMGLARRTGIDARGKPIWEFTSSPEMVEDKLAAAVDANLAAKKNRWRTLVRRLVDETRGAPFTRPADWSLDDWAEAATDLEAIGLLMSELPPGATDPEGRVYRLTPPSIVAEIAEGIGQTRH